MAEKIKNLLFNNIGYKLLALLFAIILWFVVVNLTDPSRTQAYTVQVEIENQEALFNAGKYYNVIEGTGTVKFYVTGKRSVIDKLTNEDFVAVATIPDSDFSDFQGEIQVEIFVNASKYANQISIQPVNKKLKLMIGDNQDKNYDVVVKTNGEPASGFAINSVFANPSRISLSGPDKVMEKIDSCVCYIDVDGANSDVLQDVPVVFLDADGNAIENTSELEMSSELINVTVDIVSVKTVSIKVETSGTLPEGYELDKITTSPPEVAIMGESDKLNDVTEITIPGSVISLDNLTTDLSTTVDINLYLPDGVVLKDKSNASVKIEVKLMEKAEKVISLPAEKITLSGKSEDYEYAFDAESVDVTVHGLQNTLSSLSADNITSSIDCSGLLPGSHTLTLETELPENVTADPATVKITVSEKETQQEGD